MAPIAVRLLTALLLALSAGGCSAAPPPWMGANVKVSPQAPWGSAAAQQSLRQLAEVGASRALLVAFVWQASPQSSTPVLGSDSSPALVRAGLRQMRAAGLQPVLKVHLWIPGHWAGEATPADRDIWFAAYRRALLQLAQVAADERASALIVGTELRQLQDAPQWPALLAAVRQVYRGPIGYVADGLEQAERFGYWDRFDFVGTSLYPALAAAPEQRRAQMRAAAARVQALGERSGRPVWVAELGLRSAHGSLAAPWESPEQRTAEVDTALQAQVLREWRDVLDAQPRIAGIALWCWYTDPDAGGARDSDFTVQHKPAQAVLKR
ncbi:glycoside hydrolase family 113 [Xanthomonas sacchari]|uniref:glycoside hydrolase family 113 n=1 Tax=Xanthomonas sacchari TaxID=56458 RepID=UPI0031BE37EE|nr:hypothetical protein [Xanthomonas sacchari]